MSHSRRYGYGMDFPVEDVAGILRQSRAEFESQVPRRLSAADRRAMDTSSCDDPDTRTAAEQQADAIEYHRASLDAYRRLNPPPQLAHIELLAFCAAVIRADLVVHPEGFRTEIAQFVTVWQAKRDQLGRCLRPRETDLLRIASRAIWAAMETLERSSTSTHTVGGIA